MRDSAEHLRVWRSARLMIAAAAVVLLAACSAEGAPNVDNGATTTAAAPSLPDPPWRTEPAVPGVGFNRSVLADFQRHSAVADCLPMGLATEVWTPPAGHEWRFAFNMYTNPAEYPGAEQVDVLVERAVTWKQWSDGSITENTRLIDGTYRFDLYVPSTEPGMWCTYIYDPTTKDFTGDELIQAIRFIELDSAGGR